MTAHPQTWVKVNAPVDNGVAQLVSALSAIPDLETLESCQGDADGGPAFVLFRYGDWRTCAEFIFERLLPALPPELRADTMVLLRAYDTDNAMGELRLDPAAIPALTDRLREVCQDLP